MSLLHNCVAECPTRSQLVAIVIVAVFVVTAAVVVVVIIVVIVVVVVVVVGNRNDTKTNVFPRLNVEFQIIIILGVGGP